MCICYFRALMVYVKAWLATVWFQLQYGYRDCDFWGVQSRYPSGIVASYAVNLRFLSLGRIRRVLNGRIYPDVLWISLTPFKLIHRITCLPKCFLFSEAVSRVQHHLQNWACSPCLSALILTILRIREVIGSELPSFHFRHFLLAQYSFSWYVDRVTINT